MPRFQLLVREAGKEPRVVPLADAIVVGRSRNVDLTVNDEEIGRQQFRIGVQSGFVVLESLGKTNPTRVDDDRIKAGEKTTLSPGATIRVGRSEFVVQQADDATMPPPTNAPPTFDRTMVAPPQQRPGAAPPAPRPAAGPAAGGETAKPADEPPSPMHTMPFQRPGALRPGATPPTPQPKAQPKEPSKEPPPPPPPQDDPALGGMTMAKGFRPGQFAAPPPSAKPKQPPKSPPPANDDPMIAGQTMANAGPMARPPAPRAPQQKSQPESQPKSPPPPPPAPPAPPPPAPAAAPEPAAPPPAPAPAPAPPQGDRPKTVAVSPQDLPSGGAVAGGTDLEARLHQSQPRLFVKGEGIKRSIRLLKTLNRVGRAETCDVLLPHESVSEQHAELHFDGDSWQLVDCGSTNGTFVDGEQIRSASCPVRRNSLIGLGALQVVFLCVDRNGDGASKRDEERALRLLCSIGRLDRSSADDIRRMAGAEASQSIAEIVLRDTPIRPSEWTGAVREAERSPSLLGRILRLFGIGRR